MGEFKMHNTNNHNAQPIITPNGSLASKEFVDKLLLSTKTPVQGLIQLVDGIYLWTSLEELEEVISDINNIPNLTKGEYLKVLSN